MTMQSKSTTKTASAVLVGSSGELGEFIRRRRQAQKLRIDDTAQLCGISVAALSRLETANGGVRLDTVLRALDGLGLTFVVAPKGSPLVASLHGRAGAAGAVPVGPKTPA